MTSKTTLSEITDYLPAFISKMESEGLPPLVIDTYAYYYQMVVKGESGLVYDSDIKPLGPDEVEDFNKLKAYAKAGVNALTTIWSKELGMFGIRSAAIAPGSG